jgi:hypothetical protein
MSETLPTTMMNRYITSTTSGLVKVIQPELVKQKAAEQKST